MPKAIISDASCFILFEKIDSLELFEAAYGRVLTTPTVAAEVRFALPAWVEIVSPVDRVTERTLAEKVDPDEASAIALALEKGDWARCYRLGRRYSQGQEFGTDSGNKTFDLAIRTTSFRLSPDIEKQAFLLAGENDQ